MSVYPDASLLVAAVSDEAGTAAAIGWLGGVPTGELFASGWCAAETVSGLAIKLRRAELTFPEFEIAVQVARSLIYESATPLPVDPRHIEQAAEWVRMSPTPLRAPDALHLAIARASGATVWTLDRGMAEAGRALGLGTRLLA